MILVELGEEGWDKAKSASPSQAQGDISTEEEAAFTPSLLVLLRWHVYA
jgi:hypothetical protein